MPLNTLTQFARSSASTGLNNFIDVQLSYNSNTQPGALLMVMVLARAQTTNPAMTPPVISVPTTTDGSTWLLAQSESSPLLTEAGPTYVMYTAALFYILNAAEKLASPYVDTCLITDTSVVSPNTLSANAYSYEFAAGSVGGLSSLVASAYANGTITLPETSNLVIPSTSLVYACAVYQPNDASSLKVGSGYTAGVALYGSFTNGTDQYILNALTGSVPTAFTFRSGQAMVVWAEVAVAFGPVAPTGFPHAFGSLIGF